jgi:uncharacterized protein (TIGR00730 family)
MTDAYQTGKLLAGSKAVVYFGGSSKGVMGALTGGVLEANGQIIGVLPESIAALRHYRTDIKMVIKPDMASRKQVFWDNCDSFLCLPGGFGTMDELFEIATHMKLGHTKPRPIVVLNTNGFYEPLRLLFARMFLHGTMPADRINLVRFCDTVQEAVEAVTCAT